MKKRYIILSILLIYCLSSLFISNSMIGSKAHTYYSANEFKEKSSIDYYSLYDAYEYISNNNQILLENKNTVRISHYVDETDFYWVEDYKNISDMHSNDKTEDKRLAYYIIDYDINNKTVDYPMNTYIKKQLTHGELYIAKDNNRSLPLIFTYISENYRLDISLKSDEEKDIYEYADKIISYIQETEQLNKK